jgi:hypothetical protein
VLQLLIENFLKKIEIFAGCEIHKGKTLSEETKTKMSLSHPNGTRIEVTDLELNTSAVFNSIREAAKALNIGHPPSRSQGA